MDGLITYSFSVWATGNGDSSNRFILSIAAPPNGMNAVLMGKKEVWFNDAGRGPWTDLWRSMDTTDDWHHLLWVVDTTTCTLYVNG
jgi:hypothetical protein